jgi:glycerol uptake facilitator protein
MTPCSRNNRHNAPFLGNGSRKRRSEKTKGNSSGWIVITAGWAFAVFVAVTVAGPVEHT